MTEEIEQVVNIEQDPPIPELSSMEKFFAKLFGAKGVDIMGKFQGKVRESGTSREPRIMKHPTKSGPGRKHIRGPGRPVHKGRPLEDRLTRNSGNCEPVEISAKRKPLFMNGAKRRMALRFTDAHDG